MQLAFGRLAFAAIASIPALCAGTTVGASYPERPVRLLVGFPAGGGADFTARLISTELGLKWPHQMVVDNRPGANGNIAAHIAAQAVPDGYTLLLIPFNFALSPAITKKLPFDPAADFEAVTLIASAPMVLSANPSLPVTSIQQLVALAKSRPKTLNYGSGGSGSTSHVAAELLKSLAKIDIVHVPYKGAAPAMTATIAGEVSLYFGSMPVILPHMRSGKLRVLGVTTSKRAKAAPDIQTISESGVPGYEFATWYGLVAPKKTPRAVVLSLHEEIRIALGKTSVLERLLADGAEPIGNHPDTFQKFLIAEINKWKALVKGGGLSPEQGD